MKRNIALVVWLPAIYLMISTGCHSRPQSTVANDTAQTTTAGPVDTASVEPAAVIPDGPTLYNVFICAATGDLNKDNISDSVVVMHDTTSTEQPYRLQVLFGRPDGQYQLVATSEKAILPDGGEGAHDAINLDSVLVSKGVLTVRISLLRGTAEYLYRYQNQRFELIGYSRDESDGQGMIVSEQYNLSTGRYIRTTEAYDGEDRPTEHTDTVIPIRPLPVMDTLVPFETYHAKYILF
ncbi:hypothetical protein HHL17_26455 [Chitinophaga sp. G-6-1-13]|uniref:Uncharacterized protein n=1 Tax=Chitinophaga fulva TaxID=2728842 RepID=A0A848GRX1_9BACT|nr:hypothetical protein [Chitinophaga fulva]NML40767.1 hypothetical protein [Chitinophaga fulva]